MFPSRACQIPPDASADTERGQNDDIKTMLLSDPRVQLSGFLTGRTSFRFYGLCPKAFAFLFCSPPSISISLICPLVSLSLLLLTQVTHRPKALIKITALLALLLSLSLFSFKATNEDFVVSFSREQRSEKTKQKRQKIFGMATDR